MLFRSADLAAIRHESPDNYKHISKFLALRQMSYSMFSSLLIINLASLIFIISNKDYNRDAITLFLLTSLFGILFLRRAVAFHQRIQEIITESCKILKKNVETDLPNK